MRETSSSGNQVSIITADRRWTFVIIELHDPKKRLSVYKHVMAPYIVTSFRQVLDAAGNASE